MRYKIELSYKGTNFHGWQIQKNATSIQGELERVFSMVLKEKITITGAGRTDTGVHAKFYVAHFDSSKKIEAPQQLANKFNKILSKDIAIFKIQKVADNFHSRFDATSRTYEYHIHLQKNPFLNEQSVFLYWKPDVYLMNQACKILFDYEDFTSFAKLHAGTNNNICKMYHAQWQLTDNKLVFTIKANRFLRNMVRSIVGTLLDVGRHKITIEQFREIIEGKNRSLAGQSVPPHGLYLTEIKYS